MVSTIIITAVIIAAVASAVAAYAAGRPEAFEVSRTVTIAAPPERIYPLIESLRAFNTWNPFLKADPATRLVYSGPEQGLGAAHAWEGNGKVGAGRVEITEAVAPSRVAMRLDMIKPMKASNTVVFSLTPAAGSTAVTWQMSGKHGLMGKLVGLCVDTDRMCARAFETGLADLKAKAEQLV